MRVVKYWNRGPGRWGISSPRGVQSPEQSNLLGPASSGGWGRDLQMSSPICITLRCCEKRAQKHWALWARQGGIGWGPSHAPGFCIHGAVIQAKWPNLGCTHFHPGSVCSPQLAKQLQTFW